MYGFHCILFYSVSLLSLLLFLLLGFQNGRNASQTQRIIKSDDDNDNDNDNDDD